MSKPKKKKKLTNDYWRKRARQDKLKVIRTQEKGIDNLKRLLKTNLDDVEKKITAFYDKYADNYTDTLTYTQAVQYKMKLKQNAYKFKKDKILQKILREDAPKYKIERLRALQTDLQIQLAVATAGQQKGIYKTLEDVAKVSQASVKERFKDVSNVKFNTIADKKLQKIIGSDWSGKNWSDRLWKDREKVGLKVQELLETGLPQGRSLQDMARDLKDATQSSFNDAFRLIRTEAAHVDGQVKLEGYKQSAKDLGYTEYVYDAFLDDRTSKICQELNAQKIPIDEAEVGVNYPPMHPNCRSTTHLDEGSIDDDFDFLPDDLEEKTQNTETIGFIPVTDTKEAENFAKGLGIETVEYKGLDLKTVNRMNKVFADYKNNYPEIVESMKFTGSAQNLYSHMKNNVITDEFVAQLIYKKYPDLAYSQFSSQIPQIKKNLLRNYFVNSKARATSRYNEWDKGIVFNAKEKYKDTILAKASEVANKFKPRATASVEGTINHELGHQMDKLLDLRKNAEIQKIYNSMTSQEITEKLSRYAWNNKNVKYAEFIAEAWSEYKTSRHPREVAKQIGEIIEKEYKKFKLKN